MWSQNSRRPLERMHLNNDSLNFSSPTATNNAINHGGSEFNTFGVGIQHELHSILSTHHRHADWLKFPTKSGLKPLSLPPFYQAKKLSTLPTLPTTSDCSLHPKLIQGVIQVVFIDFWTRHCLVVLKTCCRWTVGDFKARL